MEKNTDLFNFLHCKAVQYTPTQVLCPKWPIVSLACQFRSISLSYRILPDNFRSLGLQMWRSIHSRIYLSLSPLSLSDLNGAWTFLIVASRVNMDSRRQGVSCYQSENGHLERLRESMDCCWPFHSGQALRTIAGCEECRRPQTPPPVAEDCSDAVCLLPSARYWLVLGFVCSKHFVTSCRPSSSAHRTSRTPDICLLSAVSTGRESISRALNVCGCSSVVILLSTVRLMINLLFLVAWTSVRLSVRFA